MALIGAPLTGAQRPDLQRAYERLVSQEPLAADLHCAYMVSGEQADPGQSHLTWAHRELYERTVVTRVAGRG